MILVTLGTQDKAFTRLLDIIENEIKKGNIKDKVIVQAGYTSKKYKSDNMEIFDLIDRNEFNEYVKECNYLITHGGVGSILNGLKNNKKVIACPRLSKYREHVNDHQVQIINEFSKEGYILSFNDGDDLGEIIKKLDKFKPKKYVSNTDNLVKLVSDFIDNN